MNRHPGEGPFEAAGKAHKVKAFTEEGWVKAAGALLVGGLSLLALLLDSRTMKLAAASIGMALPALWLLAHLAFWLSIKEYARRVVKRRRNEKGPATR